MADLASPRTGLLGEPLLGARAARRQRCIFSPVLLVATVSSAALVVLCLIAVSQHLQTTKRADYLGFDYLFQKLLEQDDRQRMRVVSVPSHGISPIPTTIAAAAAAVSDGSALTPVVFLHGMGDSGSNPGMQSLCETATNVYPGLYVVCSNVANGLASITTPLAEQVDEFANYVKQDERLAGGFHAVGLSQGGLVLRGYVEQYNDPPVHRLISVCSPHAGIGSCPSSPLYKMVCPLWKFAPYTARLAFADYWKDSTDQATYLERSRWLADVNNEREGKNAEYKRRMMTLQRYVLVEAVNDTTVAPHVSESHGFYAWGSSEQILPLRETEGYKKDWIGVRTLDESGRLVQLQYQGDHLQFTDEFWAKVVLPHLGP